MKKSIPKKKANKPKIKKTPSLLFEEIWNDLGGEPLVKELLYLKEIKRRHRLDYSIPDLKIGMEIQGGIWMPKGGHSSALGISKDCEKNNLGILAGWRVFLLTKHQINHEHISAIKEYCDARRRAIIN